MLEKEQTENLLTKPWEKIIASGGVLGEKKANNTYITFGDILISTGEKWALLHFVLVGFKRTFRSLLSPISCVEKAILA